VGTLLHAIRADADAARTYFETESLERRMFY
jgi:hypothetical protein